MKTTVEIADNLIIEAKRVAAAECKPMRRVFEEALELRLHRRPKRQRRRIEWVTVAGGVPEETASREAMHEWLERHS